MARYFIGTFATLKNYKSLKYELGTIFTGKWVKDIIYKEKFKTLDICANIKLKMCLIESKLDKDDVRYKIVREF